MTDGDGARRAGAEAAGGGAGRTAVGAGARAHRRAVASMVAAALMWSIAGVVSRRLEAAGAFEATFWRSAFNALALVVLLSAARGGGALARSLARGGPALWVSGGCWAVMFTAFMVALTMTTVANVLVTMALGPLFTALLSRVWLGHRLPARTWAAIAAAAAGIGWMYGQGVRLGDARQWAGMLVALGVPLAAAVNWTLLQRLRAPRAGDVAGSDAVGEAAPADMLPAVLIGAVLSALLTLPLAWPLAATAADVGWLALLGVVQLAVPCLMAVAAARVLSGPEISLLALLEVVFGVAWAWLGAGERPSAAVLGGGALVLGGLVLNELAGLRRRGAGAATA